MPERKKNNVRNEMSSFVIVVGLVEEGTNFFHQKATVPFKKNRLNNRFYGQPSNLDC